MSKLFCPYPYINLYYRGRNHPKGHRVKVCCDAVEDINSSSLQEAMDERFTHPYWENLKQNFVNFVEFSKIFRNVAKIYEICEIL